MILVIDSGNTNIVFGLYKNNKLIHRLRIFTERNKSADKYEVIVKNFLGEKRVLYKNLKGAAISNVVPLLLPVWKKIFNKYVKNLKPLWITAKCKLPLKIKIDNTLELGADIIAGAAGALKSYKPPLIIIDFGTATTFFAVNKKKEITGGAISPGLNLSAQALYLGAPHLPKIKLASPPRIIGTNTEHSMQAGIFCGYIFLVEGMVNKFKKHLGKDTTVIATGGLAGDITASTKAINHIEPNLVLDGIFEIYKFQLNNNHVGFRYKT